MPSFSYLAVSVVVFVCWRVSIWKIDHPVLVKQWLVKFGEREPVLLSKKKKEKKKKKNSHNLQYLPTNAFRTKLLFVYYAHTTVISSCFPSKFCISRRQALKELFVLSSTQMRAASYSLPSLRCSEVKRITGSSENLS